MFLESNTIEIEYSYREIYRVLLEGAPKECCCKVLLDGTPEEYSSTEHSQRTLLESTREGERERENSERVLLVSTPESTY